VARNWQARLIRPTDVISIAVGKAWGLALKDLSAWMSKELVNALVDGGLGIEGISQTQFYRFISSPDGLSQLGIERNQPPKLLAAYRGTFKAGHNNKMIWLRFGDTARLKMGTPHPAAGTGHLQIESWMEWIVDDDPVHSGFVPRSRLPKDAQGRIRISSGPGGLMLPAGVFGSSGLWRFPGVLRDYEVKWLKDNIKKIQTAITNQMVIFLTRRLS